MTYVHVWYMYLYYSDIWFVHPKLISDLTAKSNCLNGQYFAMTVAIMCGCNPDATTTRSGWLQFIVTLVWLLQVQCTCASSVKLVGNICAYKYIYRWACTTKKKLRKHRDKHANLTFFRRRFWTFWLIINRQRYRFRRLSGFTPVFQLLNVDIIDEITHFHDLLWRFFFCRQCRQVWIILLALGLCKPYANTMQ